MSKKLFGQFEIARFARRAIDVNHRHVMRRADRIAGQLRRRIAKRLAEKVGRLSRNIQELVTARHAMVHAGGRDEMAHVVHLEIVAILKRLSIRARHAAAG